MDKTTPNTPSIIVDISDAFMQKSEAYEAESKGLFELTGDNLAFYYLGKAHAFSTLSAYTLRLFNSVDNKSSAEEVLIAILEIVSKL